MKKHFFLLAAGSALMPASCGSNNNNQGQTQAQIDSTVNAKLAQHDAENAAKNDSTLKAVEKEKAEAVAKEHHEERKHEGKNGNTPASPAPQQPATQPAQTAQDQKFNNRQPGNQTTQPTVTPDQQKAQDDKFNRRGGK